MQPVQRTRAAGPGAQRVDAGGRIDIHVNQDGQVTRVEGRPNDRRISYDATGGTAPYMGAPA
ncbi:hypothetical protein GXW78_26845 [Roseomonas terrae]|uniref:Uncharacterized protein n=1 Tax=Neoroseomonas terrae TaxID=424799 RepID=A0ABS5EQR5_9PROT|nr:hypothetical protein [Neoroseomonas terrae]